MILKLLNTFLQRENDHIFPSISESNVLKIIRTILNLEVLFYNREISSAKVVEAPSNSSFNNHLVEHNLF
jgi:hypothetical protein